MAEEEQNQEDDNEQENTEEKDQEKNDKPDLDNIKELFSLVYREDDLRNIEHHLSKHIKKIIDRNDICEDYPSSLYLF